MKRCPCCQSFYPNDKVVCEICGTQDKPVYLERNETTDCGQSSEDADDGVFDTSKTRKLELEHQSRSYKSKLMEKKS